MHIGDKLNNLRKDRGISQKELAERTGISASFLSDIEKGRSNPSFEKLQKLCKELHVDSGYFLSEIKQQDDDPLYKEILLLMNYVKGWNQEDKTELYNYLKAKIISKVK